MSFMIFQQWILSIVMGKYRAKYDFFYYKLGVERVNFVYLRQNEQKHYWKINVVRKNKN